MFGWMNIPMIPPTSVYTPITASSSACDQPLRSATWLNTRDSTISPVTSVITDSRTWIRRLARYWSSLSAPTRAYVQNSCSARISRPPPSSA